MRLFFSDTYGDKIVIPSMRPIAAWLALWDDEVSKVVIKREPETLIGYGDAESLPLSARINLIRSYIDLYGIGTWRGLDLSVNDLQRLANPELAQAINDKWEKPH